MRGAGSKVYRTHLLYLPYNSNTHNSSTEVTFVATLSNDRMHALEGLLAAWSGPISLALYLTDSEAARFTQLYQSSPLMKNRRNVGSHSVQGKLVLPGKLSA